MAHRNPKNLRYFNTFKEKIDWNKQNDRLKLLQEFDSLISSWVGRIPNPRDIFSREEIERLILAAIECINGYTDNDGERFFGFLIRSGYKDEPDIDENGQPLLCRATPIHHAALCHFNVSHWFNDEFCRIVAQLFRIYDKFEINYTDGNGTSHFEVACMAGCTDAIQKFLELGQDPSCFPSLNYALWYKSKEAFELLLRSGADPNLSDGRGFTPLHILFEKDEDDNDDKDDFVKMLFEICDERNEPVQVDAQDESGNTPLHLAMIRDTKKMATLLLNRDVDPNLANANGLTPLHIICKKEDYYDEDNVDSFAKVFFEINDKKHKTVQVNARDKEGWTSLQWAVVNLLPRVVDLILNHGADLSSFVFPTAEHFANAFKTGFKLQYDEPLYHFKFKLACHALIVVDCLENKGYKLNRSDALTILKILDKHGLLENSTDIDECWYEDENFGEKTKKMMLVPNLSLYDLILLSPKEAQKLVTYSDYFEFMRSEKLNELSEKYRETCALHLCEKMSRRFFRRWALDFFWELTRYRIPILCCEMILKRQTNKDLWQICLAAPNESL
uniref:Uncharacterized protein n=1 Tax=Trichogramma kaykai TaxID=54128 RepID=A0ABD2XBE1_9HYME